MRYATIISGLALVAHVVADQQVLPRPAGDGRTPRRPAGLGDVGDEGADQPALVEALVLIEALVFGGDEGEPRVFGNLPERDPLAASDSNSSANFSPLTSITVLCRA